LAQAGVVDAHRAVGHTRLLALDGTAYFSSPTIHCEHGSTHRHANGLVTYVHAALDGPVWSWRSSAGGCPCRFAPEFVHQAAHDVTADKQCTTFRVYAIVQYSTAKDKNPGIYSPMEI